jgi:hypothetical protein
MPGRPGPAATSATPAVAQDRTRRQPGSAGSSLPHPVPQTEQLILSRVASAGCLLERAGLVAVFWNPTR